MKMEIFFYINGEIYAGSFEIKPNENDGLIFSHHLKECLNEIDICQFISTLEGCFAFIYFQV